MSNTGTFTLFDSATLLLADGTELLKTSNVVKVVLVTSAETLTSASASLYGDLAHELPTGGGYTLGGVVLTGFSVGRNGSTTTWSFTGPTPKWTASSGGIPAWRWAVFYVNGTINGYVKPLIGYVLGDPLNNDVGATTAGNTLDLAGPSLLTLSAPSSVVSLSDRNADFLYRISQQGVMRYFDFNDASQLGDTSGNLFGNVGIGAGPPGSGHFPTIDNSTFCSGTGSLHFVVPDLWGPSSGVWYANFASDYSMLFRAGGQFFVQLRIRWDDFMCNTAYLDNTGACVGGGKYFDVNSGDQQPGATAWTDGITHYSSSGGWTRQGNLHGFNSGDIKIVYISRLAHRFPQMYHYWQPSLADTGFFIGLPGGDAYLENSLSPSCKYTDVHPADLAGNFTATVPGCWLFVPNQWLTMQSEVKLGTIDNVTLGSFTYEVWQNSELRYWCAYEGQPSTKIYDWTPTTAGTSYMPLLTGYRTGDAVNQNQGLGKVWLFQFQTNRDPTISYGGEGHIHYDEVIISTEQIPDPDPVNCPKAHPTLVNLAPNTCVDLGTLPWGFRGSGKTLTIPNGESLTQVNNGINANGGCQYDPKRQQIIFFGGGHGATNYNSVLRYDVRTLQWIQDYPPTPAQPDMVGTNYDTPTVDGHTTIAGNGYWKGYDLGLGRLTDSNGEGTYPLPAARHTTDQLVVIGDELIFFYIVEGAGSNTQEAVNQGNPGLEFWVACYAQIPHYDLNTKLWTFENKTPTQTDGNGGAVGIGGTSYDPFMKKVVWLDSTALYTYDPATQTKVKHITSWPVGTLVNDSGANVSNTIGILGTLEYCLWDQHHYWFTETTNQVWRLDLDRVTPANSKLVLLTTTGTLPVDSRGPTLAEHPVRYDIQNNIFLTGPFQNVMYGFDPKTKTWYSQNILGFQANSIGRTSHWGEYVPIAGCYLFYATDGTGGPIATNYHWCAYKWA